LKKYAHPQKTNTSSKAIQILLPVENEIFPKEIVMPILAKNLRKDFVNKYTKKQLKERITKVSRYSQQNAICINHL